ncbi:MAG TPA: AbrB/MazE/SpoVT family DNA-binding domain-containing protein [Algoriphagus sp.]|nr:AbrB/MazE/SpoVT family DNA-binding domain-containing protein [Algoriphagus sp.]
MVKTLTQVGNSKALIIPSELIKKYGLEKVILEETENGLLIRSAIVEDDFQKRLVNLRENKTAIYQKMENEACEPDVRGYYSNPENDLSNVDPEVL